MNTRITTAKNMPENLWITHVNAIGPYLKICGQLNPVTDLSKRLETNVLPFCESLPPTLSIEQKRQRLKLEHMYIVKSVDRTSMSKDVEYLRTRILRLIETKMATPQIVLFVEVDLIDMGYKRIMQCEELLIPPQTDGIITMPTLSSQFIMLKIFGTFTDTDLKNIMNLIARQHLMITVELEIEGHKFIKMKWKDWDFAEFLITQRKIGSPIDKTDQQDDFIRLLKNLEEDFKLDSENINNNSYNKVNNKAENPHINMTNNKMRPDVPTNNTVQRPSYSSGRINSHNNQNETEAMKLKRELLERERQLQIYLARERNNLLQTQIRHLKQHHQLQLLLPPQYNPTHQVIRNGFSNYMMGIQQQNNRLPVFYGGIPMMTRLQRPNMMPATTIAPIANLKTINISKQSLLNGNKAATNAIANTIATAAATTNGPKCYKISKFTVGEMYDVCVSFVDNGPCNFSVQLNAVQTKLTNMMNQLERIQLRSLCSEPTVGMACIARYSEDGNMYRVVINSVANGGIKVIYIDYGNSEYVTKTDLFEIPHEFLTEPVFALPFSLAGLKVLGPIDNSLKKTFKEMAIYKMCKLKVTPPEGPPVVQYCELYLQNKNILDVLKEVQKSRLVYPKAEHLSNNDAVEIRFIDSPRNFYVQKVSNIDEFDKLMDDMDKYYNSKQKVPQHIAVGAAYAVKNDHEWYRAEVIRADEKAIIVSFIDFGYERVVTKNLLSNIAEQHLKMPRQAVHCCLKGFESNEIGNKNNVTTQFEMLAEESAGTRRLFTIRVYRIHPDELHVVNLLTKELNVMKKLYKLSIPFEQYLCLEKEDFNLSGGGNGGAGSLKSDGNKSKNHQHGKGTLSINSSNENSSQIGKSSIKSVDKAVKQPLREMLPMQQKTATQDQLAKEQQQQISKQMQEQQQQPTNNFTPAQRLQKYGNKNKSFNSASDGDNNSSTSSNISKQQQPRVFNNSSRQQQKQTQISPHGRKHQIQDLLNSSFESSDRRSDASTNSNRSRNTNTSRQKDRRQNRDVPAVAVAVDLSRNQATNIKKVHQQETTKQQKQRSQNAPQGYSQSRRGSMDSQYGAITSSDSQQMSPKSIVASAAAALTVKQQKADYVSLDYVYPIDKMQTPVTEDVTICWWVSPHQFYTHRKIRASAFEELMREIQKFYHKHPLEQLKLKPGASVIARHRKDRMHYRARIIACNPMLRKYKVFFVDFGNQYTVSSEDIWQVEKRFADFPIMAYCCSFKNIVSNFDHLYIIDRMEKYLPNGATLSCEYKEANAAGVNQDLLYYVNIKVHNAFLLDRLKNDRIVTEISPELRLELLAGQQIRAKIISIKNMLNFKIIFEGCDVPLLCSYDDVRFVKSNPDIGPRFQHFYQGKSCVVNIKSVNDNKVILLRPLLPLFSDDIPSLICCKPRILQKFEGRSVFIANASRLYVHDSDAEIHVNKIRQDMYEYYEKQGLILTNYANEQICAAKSAADANWYRARIVRSSAADNNSTVEVYYLDYGNTEIVKRNQLKVLEPRFYVDQNALAIEINLPIQTWTTNDKNVKAADLNANAIDNLRLMVEEQTVIIEAVECRRNHLIAEVTLKDNQKNLVEQLLAKKLVKSRNLEYICKQLEKDKSSLLDYIVTVDLTSEDDEQMIVGVDAGKDTAPGKEKLQHQEKVEVKETNKPKNEAVKIIEQQILKSDEAYVEPTLKSVPTTTSTKQTEAATTALPIEPIQAPVAILVDNSNLKMAEVHDELPSDLTTGELAPSIATTPVHFDHSNVEQAVLSHCDNPAQFFIHTADKLQQLRKLQENLQIVASSLPPLMTVSNGANCISLYSVDKQWYRAEIIDAELMVLKFIDFGNTDCVTDATDIKEMSVFPDIEPCCIPCALPIRPNSTADWVDAANAIFNESYEKNLYFTYITHSNDQRKRPNYIQLFIDGVNIADRLIEDGFAKPLVMVESGENCYISHVNSLSDFYIQYEKDSKSLELIELCLESYEKLPHLEEFVQNKIIAALFHDDEKWYRAKLLRRLKNETGSFDYEVLFIDYGNAAVTRECREIPAEIANWPALSKKCAMDLDLNEYFGWSEAAEAKFAEIAGCGDTIFNIELKAPAADHALVHLHIDALNVNNELEPLCLRRASTPQNATKSVDMTLNSSFGAQSIATIDPNDTSQLHTAVISYLNDLESFYVQFEKDSARLEDLTTTLNTAVGMDLLQQPAEVGKLYAAIFDEDQQLYRVRVLNAKADNSYEVCFVDYGNHAFVKELRILPLDIENVRPIAKHCALNGFEELKQIGEQEAIEAFNEIVNADNSVVKLEFATVNQPNNAPLKVNVYTLNDNENILKKIKSEQQIKADMRWSLLQQPQQCLIAHCVSTQEFYVQLNAEIPKLNEITHQLAKENVLAVMPKVVMVPALNQIYAVYAKDDELYYRGLILAKSTKDDQCYEAHLIDYGNTISVSELRELPYALKNAPAKALCCSLAQDLNDIKADELELLNRNFQALTDTCFGEPFEIECVAKEEPKAGKPIVVKLKINGLNVIDRVRASKELADTIATEPVTPILNECVIVHINSTASFYTQLFADTSEIESLTEALLDADTKFPVFNELKVGALCAARFPDDNNFYRSVILQILENNDGQENDKTSCLVHFIDFGNNSVTSDFRELPAELANKKRFSQHCSLALKFLNIEISTKHFQNYIDEHYSETFQVEFIKPSNQASVETNDELMIPTPCHLFNQTKNVASEIEQMIKAADEEEE